MKKFLFVILVLSLTACLSPSGDQPASQVTVTSEVTVTLPPPVALPAPTATATEIPFTELPPEEQAAQYLAGKVQDVSGLSFEQSKEFSIAYNELKEAQRESKSVIYTDKNGNKFYLGADGKFHTEKQIVDKYIPSVTDSKGYIHVYDGKTWIRIEGSQNIQFDNFDNFPWPKTELTKVLDEKDKHPLTMPEWTFRNGKQKTMLPIIVLGKEIGEFNIVDWGDTGTITVYIPHKNDPYSVHKSTLIGNITLYADNITARSTGEIDELSTFWRTLEENTLYYAVVFTNLKEGIADTYPSTKGQEITTAYQGLAPTSQTTDIITGKIESDKTTLIQTHTLVKKLGD